MSHILIQNKGELPIWGMRLLGLSNKNEDQIGQFGTGLKESIAFLARMDLSLVIYSGLCRIDFKVKELDGQNEICFKLSEKRARFRAGLWHGLGMHPDFGKADWNDPWMIFREIVCNALDESGVDSLHHEVTSLDPSGVEGSTRVYVPITPEILGAYATIHEKLLVLGDYEVLQDMSGIGRTLKKRKSEKVQIYYRGVWVQEGFVDKSLFDYEISDLKLTESRAADWHSVNVEVARLICAFTTEQAGVILDASIKGGDVEDVYELKLFDLARMLTGRVDPNPCWAEAFEKMFGSEAVVTDKTDHFYKQLEAIGRKPIIVGNMNLREFLKKVGVPHAAKVLTHESQTYRSVSVPTLEMQESFDAVWDLFKLHGLDQGKDKPKLVMFRPQAEHTTVTLGEYKDGTCYINEEHVGSEWEQMAEIEEIAHHVSGAADETRPFQMFLLKCAAAFSGVRA